MSTDNYTEFLNLALLLAKEAGATIKKAWNQEKTLHFKGLVDIVTQTDKEVEERIISQIKQKYPDHQFLAEESYHEGALNSYGSQYEFTDAPTWIIDPIDGTTNFVHRYPFVCVSIGFAIKKEVVVGVVFNPILDELYHAVKGQGAFLNDNKISVSSAKTLTESVIATNVGYDRTEEGANFMTSNIKNLLLNNIQSMRSEGTSAMDLCGVAVGRLDTFYEYGVHPWDIAAGYLIVEEAGGIMLDPLGGEHLNIESRRVLAANKVIAPLMVEVLAKTTVPAKYARKLQL